MSDLATVDQARLIDVFRVLSPRKRVRVDVDGTHRYVKSMSWHQRGLEAADAPFAVYLTHRETGAAHLVALDLDVSGVGPDVVAEDVSRVREWLTEADIPHLVVASGPSGGQHVWAACPEGVPADVVGALATRLLELLPSLDPSALRNARTGAVRPPGAAHRHGGRAEIDTFYHPDQAVALDEFAAGAPAAAFERLLELLPASTSTPLVDGELIGEAFSGGPRPVAVDDEGVARLARDRRDLSPAVWERVLAPVDGDASAALWGVLVGAALAGWGLAEVAALVERPDAAGLIHVHSTPAEGGRVGRTAEASAALLRRQWERAVARAADLPVTVVAADDAFARRAADVTATVTAVLDRMAAEPGRWAAELGYQRGPCDRLTLLAVLKTCLAARRTEVSISAREVAVAAGISASTAALALQRLATDHILLGDRWLERTGDATGTRAATYRLVNPTENMPVDKGRTLGTPTPPATPGQAAPKVRVSELLGALVHDVWTPPRGLSHHVSATYAQIATTDGPQTPKSISRGTSYSLTTTIRHLQELAEHRLITLTHHRKTKRIVAVRIGRRSLDSVATELGVDGALAQRAARYDDEQTLWSWWCAEQNWRTAPAALKPMGVPDQIDIDWVPDSDDPRWTYGRFPTRADGRADWATARRIITGEPVEEPSSDDTVLVDHSDDPDMPDADYIDTLDQDYTEPTITERIAAIITATPQPAVQPVVRTRERRDTTSGSTGYRAALAALPGRLRPRK